jgi:hypothetical protein
MQNRTEVTEIRQALLRLATLMDEDNARHNNVGIPVSHGRYLAGLAVSGTADEWDAEWVRILRTDSMQAATIWADLQEKRTQTVIELVYPDGATATARSADEVRALAAEAKP